MRRKDITVRWLLVKRKVENIIAFLKFKWWLKTMKIGDFFRRIQARWRIARQRKQWKTATDEFDPCFSMDGLSMFYLSKEEEKKYREDLIRAKNKIHLQAL